MPTFYDTTATYPLTQDEKAWCKKLENLLKKTPKRFGIYTTGDPSIGIFDRKEMECRGIPQEECNSSKHGLDLALIRSSEDIQGWCG